MIGIMPMRGNRIGYLCGFVFLLLAGNSQCVSGATTFPSIPLPKIPSRTFGVLGFGAVGDGKTSNTKAFAAAIGACAGAGGGVVNVPAGIYLTGPIDLVSDMELHLEDGATILFSDDPDEYPVGAFKALPTHHRPLMLAAGLHDVAITGRGKIDGHGERWWKSFRAATQRSEEAFVETRPKLLVFDRCRRVHVEGITLTNSPMYHLAPTQSEDVVIEGVTVIAPADSPNTDSCNPSGWNYRITGCTFDVGDDDIAIKPLVKPEDGRPSCENIFISDCRILHGHGLSIGGQTRGGVKNVLVENCRFDGTLNGIRLKSERAKGGVVEDVVYRNIMMTNVKSPVTISSYYHDLPAVGKKDMAHGVDELTPIWRNVEIHNLIAIGCEDAGLLMGLPEMPLENVTFENVRIVAAQPMRIGNVRELKWINVSIDVKKAGEAVQIEGSVLGDGLPR